MGFGEGFVWDGWMDYMQRREATRLCKRVGVGLWRLMETTRRHMWPAQIVAVVAFLLPVVGSQTNRSNA